MERLRSIQEAKFLKGLSESDKQHIAAVARDFGFKKGEYLFRLGKEADALFVIRSGSVELTLPLSILNEEKEVVMQELGPGETLAWSALVEPNVLTMSARATTDVELIGFKREELQRLFEAEPDVGFRVMSNLAAIVGRRLHVTHALWARELQRSVGEKYK